MNKILLYINNSQYIKGWLNSICKEIHYRDDLFQHCLIQITNEELERLNDLYINGNLDKYFIQIMRNQYKSNKSYFYKEYINNGFYNSDFIKLGRNVSDFKTLYFDNNNDNEETKDDENLNKIKQILDKADIINRELFIKMYFEEMSYKEISEYYGIKYQNVRLRILKVKNFIKDTIKN